MTGPTPDVADVHALVQVSRGDFHLDVELDLPAGTTTALVGPNGAGKSTVVAALAGLLPLQGGRIVLGGEVVDDPRSDVFVPAAQRRVGVVFQDGLLFEHLTVLENVAFGPRSRGVGRVAARRAAAGWLERLGVGDLAPRRPSGLSGGEAQRVALARTLVTDPLLVLLDEPLSALDVRAGTGLRRLLGTHLATLDAPRLLVTHDPVEAFLLADSIAVLEDGRITQVGTAAELRQRPRTSYAAELVGVNLLRGRARAGEVEVAAPVGAGSIDAGPAPGASHPRHVLTIASSGVNGPVLVAVPPQAIALSVAEPSGSQRNTWLTEVEHLEPFGDRVRVTTGGPVPLTAEVTPGAVTDLDLTPGAPVWVAIKATELRATPID